MIIQSVRDVGDDLFPTATPSVHPYYIPIPIDNTPLPPMAMIAVKLYAFGGLVFMIAVIIAAIVYWFWTILIKREWADSPGWLDLHPEVNCVYFNLRSDTNLHDVLAHERKREGQDSEDEITERRALEREEKEGGREIYPSSSTLQGQERQRPCDVDARQVCDTQQ